MSSINDINNLMNQINLDYNSHNTQTINTNKQNINTQNTNTPNNNTNQQTESRNQINNKLNEYLNSKEKYIHNEHQNNNNNLTNNNNNNNNNNNIKYNGYQQSLTDNNMFKKDLRNNMNNRLDSFLFENPGEKLPALTDIQEDNNLNNYNFGLSYRPITQERSKNLYKQETNERLNDYSPLSRSTYFPTSDLSNNTNNFSNHNKKSPRDIMNERLSNITPLSSFISLKNPSKDNKNIASTHNEEKKNIHESKPSYNYNDVNLNCNNVVFQDYPVFTS